MADGHSVSIVSPGLGDGDDECLPVQDRVAVAELDRQLDLAGNARPVLDGVLRDQSCVVSRPAGDDDDLVDLTQLLVGIRRISSRLSRPSTPIRPSSVSATALRLLGDLLEHEVVVAVLLGGRRVPVDVVFVRLGRRRRRSW